MGCITRAACGALDRSTLGDLWRGIRLLRRFDSCLVHNPLPLRLFWMMREGFFRSNRDRYLD